MRAQGFRARVARWLQSRLGVVKPGAVDTVAVLPASGRYTALGLPAALSKADLAGIARYHPLVVGLFEELPEPHTPFPLEGEWLQAAALVLPSVYPLRDAAPLAGVSDSPTPSPRGSREGGAIGVGDEPRCGAASLRLGSGETGAQLADGTTVAAPLPSGLADSPHTVSSAPTGDAP